MLTAQQRDNATYRKNEDSEGSRVATHSLIQAEAVGSNTGQYTSKNN